ncbi:vesicle-associated membrane protein 2-like isoform X1 [Sphaerodactylus townsendi]|uniref:vesicle-associated membrane protein 2-like isoform X1 n=1 Tax=Sphaerodactylus townsendi TaxID=933632 RepID=UPI002025F110|nr:vesicle-associated membrane protein 2-like isoform X1 [Sphaerodactylus townsendi]
MSDPDQPSDLGAGPEATESSGGPPEQPPDLTSNRRLNHAQAEVNQVVDILHDNMTKVIERDVMISSLDDKADSLHESAKMFENSTTALARKYWCQNMKMMIILGVICAIAVIAIAGTTERAGNEAAVFNLKWPFSLSSLEGWTLASSKAR